MSRRCRTHVSRFSCTGSEEEHQLTSHRLSEAIAQAISSFLAIQSVRPVDGGEQSLFQHQTRSQKRASQVTPARERRVDRVSRSQHVALIAGCLSVCSCSCCHRCCCRYKGRIKLLLLRRLGAAVAVDLSYYSCHVPQMTSRTSPRTTYVYVQSATRLGCPSTLDGDEASQQPAHRQQQRRR